MCHYKWKNKDRNALLCFYRESLSLVCTAWSHAKRLEAGMTHMVLESLVDCFECACFVCLSWSKRFLHWMNFRKCLSLKSIKSCYWKFGAPLSCPHLFTLAFKSARTFPHGPLKVICDCSLFSSVFWERNMRRFLTRILYEWWGGFWPDYCMNAAWSSRKCW